MLLEYVFNIIFIVFHILIYSKFLQIIYYYLLNKLVKGFTHNHNIHQIFITYPVHNFLNFLSNI